MLTVSGSWEPGLGKGIPELGQGRREERPGAGRHAGWTNHRRVGGEVPNPAPPTWPFTRTAAAQEVSSILIWGGWAQVASPSPQPHILASSLLAPGLLSQATPCPQPGSGASIMSSRRQLQSKVQAPDPGLQAGSEPLGLGRSSSLLKLLPTLGFRSIVKVTGWRKDSDGREVAEGSMGPTRVCSSRIFSTPHFPPALLGVSDNSSCES